MEYVCAVPLKVVCIGVTTLMVAAGFVPVNLPALLALPAVAVRLFQS